MADDPPEEFAKCLPDDALERVSLANRYEFLNRNLEATFETKELGYLREIEEFCLSVEARVDHAEDFYPWIPWFGERGLVTRGHHFREVGLDQQPHGLVPELCRVLACDFFDPEFTMAMGASVLAVNPILSHHEGVPARLDALRELVTGTAIGCICITEPERGSDALHLLTRLRRVPGGVRLTGSKIYNTNAPRADWAVVYACEEPSNPKTMAQVLVKLPAEGLRVERVNVPWTPRMYLGREEFDDVFVPQEMVLGDVGRGVPHLLEGLVKERIGIAALDASQCWNAVAHASAYANVREQFGKPIIQLQGVGFTLADLWARTANLTRAVYEFCRKYDERYTSKGREPAATTAQQMAVSASQLKYHAAWLTRKVCYEAANLMGGAGLCGDTLVKNLVGISMIQEVGGGARQIQQYIMSRALRAIWKLG
ncbi:MAG: acyl-CoA dehydrogenase family protein [Promethearchaeota archaeon]